MEQRETRSSSIAQWCSRSYRDCHAVTEYHTVGWKTSADHAVAELSRPDVKVKQRAKQIQGSRTNQTVVLEVVPRTTTTHSGVEGLSGCRGRVPKTRQKTGLRVSATRCCKLPDRGARVHLPRTHDHAVAQYYVVVLEVPEEASAEW